MRPHHSEEKTEMQTTDRPERPEWLDAWEAIDADAVQALAYALHGYGVDAIAARDALYALSGEWELVRAGAGGVSPVAPVEGSGGHEPFQSSDLTSSHLLAAASIVAAEAEERGVRHWTDLADRLTREAALRAVPGQEADDDA